MPSYEKGMFLVLLRDGSSFQIESDDWKRDEQAAAFRFFDVDETEEGPVNHEVAWLSVADVVGVVEAERLSKRRGGPQSSAGGGRETARSSRRSSAKGAARRKAGPGAEEA